MSNIKKIQIFQNLDTIALSNNVKQIEAYDNNNK